MNYMTIETGVPIPEANSRGKYRALLTSLKVGQSFAVEAAKRGTLTAATSVLGGAKRFTIRSVKENGAEYVRVWRTAE